MTRRLNYALMGKLPHQLLVLVAKVAMIDTEHLAVVSDEWQLDLSVVCASILRGII
jgi:hypothetical protein